MHAIPFNDNIEEIDEFMASFTLSATSQDLVRIDPLQYSFMVSTVLDTSPPVQFTATYTRTGHNHNEHFSGRFTIQHDVANQNIPSYYYLTKHVLEIMEEVRGFTVLPADAGLKGQREDSDHGGAVSRVETWSIR